MRSAQTCMMTPASIAAMRLVVSISMLAETPRTTTFMEF